MDYSVGSKAQSAEIIELFIETFTASEGKEEGLLIGELVRKMLATTPEKDLYLFTAQEQGNLTGCIIFSPLTFEQDSRTVFILSPVAVHPNHQGQGVGQALISYGLDTLRNAGIDVAITYGDPAFYSKVGFYPISETIAQAPLALQHPEGWLGQSLNETELRPLQGPSQCVDALNDPTYW
ncbi:MAG: N-acetyltransferase [Cohaesibacter sp.]|nr:N-acetyltransferase [Cohaesibacter sp.]